MLTVGGQSPVRLWRFGVAILLFFAVSTAIYWSTRGQDNYKVGGDGHYHVLLALSVVEDGDIDLVDEYGRFGDPYGYGITPDGTAGAPFSLGPGLAMVPLTWLGVQIYGAPNDLPTLYGPIGQLAAFTSVFLTTLTFGFCVLILLESLTFTASVAIASAAVVGTPLFFYTHFHPSYTHAFSAMGTAAAVWSAYYWRKEPTLGRAVMAGVAIGVAGLGRTQYLAVAFFMIAFWVEQIAQHLRLKTHKVLRQRTMELLTAGWVSVAVVALQLLLWLPANHNLRSPIGDHYMHLNDPAWAMLLWSSRNGLFPWSPLMAFGGLGFVLSFRAQPATVWAALALFVSMWWVNASAWDWHASWGFGARRFSSMAVVLALGLGGLWVWLKRQRTGFRYMSGVVLLGVSLMSMGMALNQGQTDGRTDINTRMLSAYLHGITALGFGAGQSYHDRREEVLKPLRSVLKPIYDDLGNPFSFPMTWWLRFYDGFPIRRFDDVWGRALLERSFKNPWPHDAQASMRDAAELPIQSGFEPQASSVVSNGGKARLLLPFLMRECAQLRFRVRGSKLDDVFLRVNGVVLPQNAQPELDGVWFEGKLMIHRGFNSLELESSQPVVLEALRVHLFGPQCSE